MPQTEEGEFLRALRKQHKLSQQQLAELAGTTQAQIARWESGQRSPTVAALRNVLDALGLDLRLDAARRREQPPPDEWNSEAAFTATIGTGRGPPAKPPRRKSPRRKS